MKPNNLINIVLIMIIAGCFLTYPASATDYTLVTDTVKSYTPTGSTSNEGTAWTKVIFDNTNYNGISSIVYSSAAQASYPKESDSVTFVVSAGATGTGTYSYSKTNDKQYWFFNDITVTGSSFIITYDVSISMPSLSNTGSTYAVDINSPALFQSTTVGKVVGVSTGGIPKGSYTTLVSSNYPFSYYYSYNTSTSLFNVTVDKSGTIISQVNLTNQSNIFYTYESVPTAVDFNYSNQLCDGLNLYVTVGTSVFSASLSNEGGICTSTYVLEKELIPDPVTGVDIMFDEYEYAIGDIVNISWIRTSSTPFGYHDYVVLIYPYLTGDICDFTVLGGTYCGNYIIDSPTNSGNTKVLFDRVGSYEVDFGRCLGWCDSSSIPTVLASDTAVVSPESPSYLLAASPQGAGIAFNVTYLFGYTPQDQGELNSIVVDKLTRDTWEQSNAYSLDNTAIVKGTEYNKSITVGDIGKYRLRLFEWHKGFVASVVIDAIAVDIPIQKNIVASIIEVDKTEYVKSDELSIYYAVDNTNYSNYYSKYISIIHSSGSYPETSHILITEQEDTINYASASGHLQRAKSGLNYVQLRARNTTADILLVNTSFNISFVDIEGYGLDIIDPDVCKGEKITIKYATPTNSTLRVNIAPDNTVPQKYYEVSINGSHSIDLKLSQAADYQVLIYEGTVGNIKKFTTATTKNCIIPVPTQTYKGVNGTWTPTNENIKETCTFWDNCVRGAFTSQGVNDSTRLLFAIFCIVVMMFFGMVVSKGNFGVSVILGFLPYAFFSYLSISTPCGQYMPLWVTIFIALIIGIKMRWFT